MQIAQILGGYSLGQADLLRRAMGKKLPEEMEKQRAIFVSRVAPKNSIAERNIEQACSTSWCSSPSIASTNRTVPLMV